MKVPGWVKVLGLVGGAAGAVGATLASGGTLTVAVLVGVGALTSGASALYMMPPGTGVKGGAKGQAVDAENPK